MQPAIDPNGVAQTLKAFMGQLTANYLAYFAALAALGTLTMSLIQAIKTLFQARRGFHRWRLRRWLKTHVAEATKVHGCQVSVDRAEEAIVKLGADNDRAAFYGSEPDDLFRQLTAVAQLTLDYPNAYTQLVGVMAAYAISTDFAFLVGKTQPKSPQELQDALRRIREQTNQSVIGLRLSMAWEWQIYLQLASFVLSFSLAFGALLLGYGGVASYFGLLITSLLAAFLAPVARDIVAALEKLRS